MGDRGTSAEVFWEEVRFRLLNKAVGGGTHVGGPLFQRYGPHLWKQVPTGVHIAADGFVRWTADYKHVPEAQEKVFFQ